MNVMILFDAIMTVLGTYLLFMAQKMKRERRVPSFLITEQDLMRCRDQAGLSEYLFPRIVIFSVVILVFGILGLVNDLVISLGNVVNIVMILIFLVAWVWFSAQLRKARKNYCG